MSGRQGIRQEGIITVKRRIDNGILELADVQSEVRKYGVSKMSDLLSEAFVKCAATLTQGRTALA
jgi:hypothetical protein